MILNEMQVAPLLELYDRGLYHQAYQAGSEYGPIKDWDGPRGRMISSRLASHLGAPRLSRLQRIRAWRKYPNDPEVLYYHAYTVLGTKGPLGTWKFLNEVTFPDDASKDLQSSWHAMHAQVLAELRDFDAAEEWLKRAEDIAPDNPWVHSTWSSLLETEDRYADALAAAERALGLVPWYRPAVQAKGHLLTLMGQDDQAYEFLKDACNRLESAAIYYQLIAVLLEREAYHELSDAVQRIDELTPLTESEFTKSNAALRSLIAYRLGDLDTAIRFAQDSNDKFESKLAERLADPARRPGRRVHLPVGFVRQHHKTCVPATLTAISQFWSMPAEHLSIAEAICYDGTTDYNERLWATKHGWHTREFTLTEQSAYQLIDAGIPFTLTTTSPTGGHLQAVIGYDSLRGTLIIRDPFHRVWSEGFTDSIIEAYQAFGPRGMALVPIEQRSKLDAIDLPDADLWDELHQIGAALELNQRENAEVVFKRLQAKAPEHRVTIEAERRLMLYDGNLIGLLNACEKLLDRYPDDLVLQLMRLSYLRESGRREDRLTLLEQVCQRHDAHPSFLSQLARELSVDAREHEQALSLIKRAMRMYPSHAANYSIMAAIFCDQLKFDDALQLYRFATCLEDQNEDAVETYFRLAQYRKQTDTALAWIRRRVERFGTRSSRPAQTLDWALRRLNRDAEATEVLETALKLRPNDGELLLYMADVESRTSFTRMERAKELCAKAEPFCARSIWLRTRARLASLENNTAESLAHWRQVLELQPQAIDAHRAVAGILSELEGQEAALAHLKAAAEQFPRYQPLLALWIEWLSDEPPEVTEPLIRRLLELNPADAWAHRELGFLLLKQKRLDEARDCAEAAGKLDPTHFAWFHLRGELAQLENRMSDACEEYRSALRLSIDNEFAFRELLACSASNDERLEALKFIREELSRQTIYGDGLLNFRIYASSVYAPEELLQILREALAARPDLWHAWSACVRHLVDMNELDQAYELVCQACERFPLLPRIWLDRAIVCQYRLDSEGELAAFEKCHEINPNWTESTRQLSDVYFRKGDFESAAKLLRRSIVYNPLEGMNYGWLADVEWKLDQKDEAFKNIERAVQLAPGYTWAWDTLRSWSDEEGDHERPLRVAKELTERRPGEARSWITLARMMGDDQDRLPERIDALRKAVELAPRSVAAHDQLARCLFENGQREEAEAECRPAIFGDRIPSELLARSATFKWNSDERQQAIDELKSILKNDPSFSSGWSELQEWTEAMSDHEGALEAARMVVRLNPHSDVAMGTLAKSLLNAGQRDEAKDAFRHCFELFPNYVMAGMWLFDLQIEDNDLDAANQTLKTLEIHDNSAYVTSRQVVLACAARDRATAKERFRILCLDQISNTWPIDTAFSAMLNAKWLYDVREVVNDVINEPIIQKQVGAILLKAYVEDELWTFDKSIDRLVERHLEAAIEAIRDWTDRIYNWKTRRGPQLKKFAKRNRDRLWQSTTAWALVGRGFYLIDEFSTAWAWYGDWTNRTDLEPWMLLNATEVARGLKKDDLAAAISRHALTLKPDGWSQSHRSWIVADAISRNDFQSASEERAKFQAKGIGEYYELLTNICDAVLKVVDAPDEQKREAFTHARRKLDEVAVNPIVRRDLPRRLFFRKAIKIVASQAPGVGSKLWYWFRLLISY